MGWLDGLDGWMVDTFVLGPWYLGLGKGKGGRGKRKTQNMMDLKTTKD